MAYKVIILYQLYMPSYFLGTFTEYPYAHIEEKEAEEYIRKADKSRASYYNYYTDKIWGAAESYDLCISSSVYGIDETTAFIREFVSKR